ncbi:MAG TPA: hypothetical protein VNA04_03535 [Thermoanaerobaculia bacterium]|nr:hypothetical protein [Thermoanaerobaculia bacterium]
MTVLVVILTVTALGLPPALAIDRRQPPIVLGALGFLYGSGLVYAVLLTQAIAGVRWSLVPATAALVALSAIAFLWSRRPVAAGVPPVRLSAIDIATAALVAAYVSYVTIDRPRHWDFWAIWGLKGRVFYEAGGIDWRFLESETNRFAHPDYPLLVPLNFAYAALAAGEWDDRWTGLLPAAFGIALLLVVRAAAAAEVRPAAAAATAFAAAGFALSPQIGLAEAPLIAFGTAGLLMVRRALRLDDDGAMRHGALLLGLAGVTKNEGVTLCLAAVAGLLVAQAPRRRFLSLWPAAVLIGSWMLLRAVHTLPTDLTSGAVVARFLSRLDALPQAAAAMLASLGRPFLWLVLLVAVLLFPKRIPAGEKFLLVAAGVQLVFFAGAYLSTPHDAAWHIAASWGRISRQLGPPVLFAVMVALAQSFTSHQDGAHAEARSDG